MGDRRLLIDARPIFHPTAGGRGIGNYTLGLLDGLAEIGAPFTAFVAHMDNIETLADRLGRASTVLWGRDVVRRSTPGAWYVATGLFLHPLSFDPIPQVITEAGVPVASVLYDVIPYRFPDRHQVDEIARRLARVRAPLARTADLTVAVSKFSAETAIEALALDRDRVRVIGAGVDRRFVPPTTRLPSDRVVAVTGPDPRKNTDGLLAGWARVPDDLRSRHPLVVVSGGPAALLERWSDLATQLGCSASVELTGAVSDARMVELLQQAVLVVQPSLEEGFGLPVLEAAACGAPVICSNVSALPEVLDEPAATFDPLDPDDLAAAIVRALTDDRHRRVLLDAASGAVSRWRWSRVAEDLLAAITDVPSTGRLPRPLRHRIAIVNPPRDEVFIRAFRAATTADVVALVDPSTTSERVEPDPEGQRWPAAALGRYVKYHEFDHVVVMLDSRRPHDVAGRIASRFPAHVWLRGPGAIDEAMLGHARSIIVGSMTDAAALAAPLDERAPILVLPPGHDEAKALVAWLSEGHLTHEPISVAAAAGTL